MHQKYKISLAFVAFFLLLSACGNSQTVDKPAAENFEPSAQTETKEPSADEIKQQNKQKDAQTFDQAVDAEDLSKCEEITDQTLKEVCVNQVQVKQGTYQAEADSEKSPIQAQKEQDNLIFQQATDAQDIAQCEYISDVHLQAVCQNNIIIEEAQQTNDPTKCEELSTPELVEDCKESI